jgi:hypothetical protein
MVHLLAATGTIDDEVAAANLQKLRKVEDEMFRRLQELRRSGGMFALHIIHARYT